MPNPQNASDFYAQREAQRAADALGQSMAFGQRQDPDAYSAAISLGRKVGVRPSMLEDGQSRTEVEQDYRVHSFDANSMVRFNPRLTQWLSQPDNAAIAHDDLPALGAIEGASSQGPDFSYFQHGVTVRHKDAAVYLPSIGRWVNKDAAGDFVPVGGVAREGAGMVDWMKGWSATPEERDQLYKLKGAPSSAMAALRGAIFGGAYRIMGGFASTTLTALQAIDQGQEAIDRAAWQKDQSEGHIYPYAPGLRVSDASRLMQALSNTSDFFKGKAKENEFQAMPITEVRGFRDGVKAAASLIGGVVPYLAPGSAAVKMGSEAIAKRDTALEAQGMDPATRLGLSAVAALPDVAIGSATGHAGPTSAFDKLLMGPARTGLAFFAKHFGDAVVDEGLGITPIKDPNETLSAWMTRHLHEGGTESFLSGFALTAVPAIAQLSIGKMADAASTSKLKARNAQVFKEGMEAVLKDTGSENILVPSDRFQALFQNPSEVATRLGVDLTTALAANTDVTIKTADFLAHLKPEEQQALMFDMRTNPDQPTHREWLQWANSGGAERLKQLGSDVTAEAQAAPEYQLVREEFRKRYMAAGERPEIADDLAKLQANAYANMARESGLSPVELLRIYDPKVVMGEAPTLAGTPGSADTALGGTNARDPREVQRDASRASLPLPGGDGGLPPAQPWTYGRGVQGDGGSLRVLGVPVLETWKLDRATLPEKFKDIKSPDVHELDYRDPQAAGVFHEAISGLKEGNKFSASVHVYDVAEYAGMRMFLTENGNAGFALKPDGDIISVFSKGDAKGSVGSMLEIAKQAGGTKLDCFDTVLPEIYGKHGFEAVARMKWNDEFAPEGWDKTTFSKFNGGEPDVVFMVLNEKAGPYKEGDGQLVTDYDQALQIQADAQPHNPAQPLLQEQSTRTPWSPASTEDHMASVLLADLESLKSAPGRAGSTPLEKTAELLRSYVNYQKKGKEKPEKVVGKFIDHVVANLLFLHDHMNPELRDRAKLWYDGARLISEDWAKQYGTTPEQVAGMVAVMSPQRDWFQNVSLGQRVLDIMTQRQDHVWDETMTAWVSKNAALSKYQDTIASVTGKRLSELTTPYQKALWTRAFDEAHNPRTYRSVSPEGNFGEFIKNAPNKKGEAADTSIAWGSLDQIEKAISIFEDGSPKNISDRLGEAHKVRNFYNNIFAPNSEKPFVTIDTHAVAAGLLRPLAGSDTEVGHNLGGGVSSAQAGLSGTYPVFAEAYKRAAEARGLKPREMQSITWEAVRGLFTPEFKTPANNKAVAEVWKSYNKGEVTLEQAHAKILDLAGGVNDPAWSSGAGAGETWSSTYQGELDGSGVSRQPARRVDAGSGERAAGVDPKAGVVLHQSAIESPKFKEWFGDSKAVDESGKPEVFYHGTYDEFSQFRDRKGRGIFFSTDPSFASWYGNAKDGRVIPAFLKTEKPFDYKNEAAMKDYFDHLGLDGQRLKEWQGDPEAEKYVGVSRGEWDTMEGKDFQKFLKDKGYDAYYVIENGARNIAVFDSKQVKSATGNSGAFDPANPDILHQPGETKPRGWFQILPDGTFEIGKSSIGDLSTFVHEPAHSYIYMLSDLVKREGATEALKADHQKILDFLGAKDGDVLTTEQHEKWARANELYLREGKAPSADLQSTFQRFAIWLGSIYRKATELKVELDPEIRGVMDRLYAGDKAIEEAQRMVDMKPMFATAEEMGMSKGEFDHYVKTAGKAISSAQSAVLTRLQKEYQRERESWWKEETLKTREEVDAEIDADPTYKAIADLKAGEIQVEGSDPISVKINRQSIIDQFGEETLAKMPHGLRDHKGAGSMDAEAAAELMGFESGQALIKAITEAEPRRALAERLTSERMKAKHGDLLTDGTLNDKAVEELHNSARGEMLMAEIKAIKAKQAEAKPAMEFQKALDEAKTEAERQAAQSAWDAVKAQRKADQATARAAADVPPMKAFVDAAREIVDRSSVRELEPYRYLVASRKSGREAFEAMSKGDYATASDAKQKELLNHHLFIEGTKAVQEARDFADYGKQGEGKKFQMKLGKAGGDYLNQWNALADLYEFRDVPYKALDQRAMPLATWAAAMAASGEGVVIDPMLMQATQPKNWREVPLSEVRAVRDALKNIQTLAERQNRVLKGEKEADFHDAVRELRSGALGNLPSKPLPLDPNARSAMDKVVSTAKALNTGIVKFERVIDHLDQGDINGPWRRYIFEPMALAQFKEHELNVKVTTLLAEAMETMPKEQRHNLLESYDIPGIGKVTRKFILSMAMNWGNASNREKMQTGMGWADRPEAIAEAFKKLDRKDWEFVQKSWDAIDQLWPEIAALQVRMTGVEPPKVERQAFAMNLPDGTVVHMQGGYYPVVYDPKRSSQGAQQADVDIMNSEGGFQGAVTFKGHTNERVKFSAPMLMDFEQVLSRHVNQVIKDISHREAAMSVSKLMRDQAVRETIAETMGAEYEAMMMPWLKGTVNDLGGQMGPDAGAWKNLMMTTRSNMVLAGLSFRAGSIVVQATDFGRSLTRVKGRHLGQALLDFGAHPIETTRMVRELSKEMAGRSENLDRDVRSMMKRTQGSDGFMNHVQKLGMEGLAWADTITSVTTWLGAFRQAEAEGKVQEQAVREADRTVRLTMMSSAPKDLVAVQRVGDVGMKFVTMFMGDATATYGTLNEGVRQIGLGKNVGTHLFKMAMVGAILPLVGQLIKNRGPQDQEDKVWWAVKNGLLSMPSSLPIARDIAQSLDSGMDYKFSPIDSAINKGVKAVRTTGKVFQGKADWEDAFTQGIDAAGTLLGVPGTSQAMTSLNYQNRVRKGKLPKPKTTVENIKNTILGPPPTAK